jgi:hypothetical protein
MMEGVVHLAGPPIAENVPSGTPGIFGVVIMLMIFFGMSRLKRPPR